MPATAKDYRWLFAVSAAALFPALILHTTCIAVMGPGTWGSGIEESLPELKQPTALVEYYRQEFLETEIGSGVAHEQTEEPYGSEILGEIRWTHRSGDRTIHLSEDFQGSSRRQHLYLAEDRRFLEIQIPTEHIVVRPQWAVNRIIYERWNPWAIPPTRKLRRYVASWADASLRPEAALYGSESDFDGWRYLMPGHSLSVAPDGRQAALLRSGALLAGYYSIHVWHMDDPHAQVVISLREHDGNATESFSLRWSADSSALRIFGRTGGFDRRSSRSGGGSDGIALDLLYLVSDHTLYDLNLAG